MYVKRMMARCDCAGADYCEDQRSWGNLYSGGLYLRHVNDEDVFELPKEGPLLEYYRCSGQPGIDIDEQFILNDSQRDLVE